MTVRQNIALAYRGESAEKDSEIAALLSRYEIERLAGRYPVQLSGGEQQRAALARIFACKPKALLLDEPFSALDTFLRENMQSELRRIIKSYDGSVILVTHSRDEAYKIADDLVILDKGRTAAKGSVHEVFAHPGNARAARITGCKNISAIEKREGRRFFATDWGIELEAAEEPGESQVFAGVRAHSFVPADAIGAVNTFPVDCIDEIDGPFEKDVFFRAVEAGAGAKTAGVGADVETNATDVTTETDGAGANTDVTNADGADSKTGRIWWITDQRTDVKNVRMLSVAPESILLLEE